MIYNCRSKWRNVRDFFSNTSVYAINAWIDRLPTFGTRANYMYALHDFIRFIVAESNLSHETTFRMNNFITSKTSRCKKGRKKEEAANRRKFIRNAPQNLTTVDLLGAIGHLEIKLATIFAQVPPNCTVWPKEIIDAGYKKLIAFIALGLSLTSAIRPSGMFEMTVEEFKAAEHVDATETNEEMFIVLVESNCPQKNILKKVAIVVFCIFADCKANFANDGYVSFTAQLFIASITYLVIFRTHSDSPFLFVNRKGSMF